MATIRDSIIAAASAVKGEAVDAGPTISDALDALADALAGEDVAKAPLIADEFAIMAQYLNSGGGGMDIGRQGTVTIFVNESDEGFTFYMSALTQKDGDIIVSTNYPSTGGTSYAQGVYVMGVSFDGLTVTDGTYKVGDEGTPHNVDVFTYTAYGEDYPAFGFVMPDATEDDLDIFVELTAEAAPDINA